MFHALGLLACFSAEHTSEKAYQEICHPTGLSPAFVWMLQILFR